MYRINNKILDEYSLAGRILSYLDFPNTDVSETVSCTPTYISNKISGTCTTANPEASLILHFEGEDASTPIIDSASVLAAPSFSCNGTAQIDTAQKIFGSASLLLDGDSDYIEAADNDFWKLDNGATGDFTLYLWVRFPSGGTALGKNYSLFSQYVDANNLSILGINFTANNVATLSFTVKSGGSTIVALTKASLSMTVTNWYQIMITKNGSIYNLYHCAAVGGLLTLQHSYAASGAYPNLAAVARIGMYTAGDERYLNGWLDEFVISKY